MRSIQYSLALTGGAQVPRLEAIPHLQRAIELDPTFALAHAFLSGVYTNTNQTALAPAYSRKAFELRDRVSERERFFISWRYYRDATQALDKALDLTRSWTATYPREAVAFNSLGVVYLRLGRFDESLAPFREAIRLDPKFTPAYANLAATFMNLNQFSEARSVLRQLSDQGLDFAGARRISYLLAYIQNDAARWSASSRRRSVRRDQRAFGWQAHTLATADIAAERTSSSARERNSRRRATFPRWPHS
jgi:Tfp pilus assembly protein PilF